MFVWGYIFLIASLNANQKQPKPTALKMRYALTIKNEKGILKHCKPQTLEAKIVAAAV